MCRSSRLTRFSATLLLSALIPASAGAQLYGFPSDVGVIDDGYGVLPPTGPSLPAGGPDAAFAPPPFPATPPAPPPCPLVIKVGRGLKRPAQARVVYGRPSPCS